MDSLSRSDLQSPLSVDVAPEDGLGSETDIPAFSGNRPFGIKRGPEIRK
jgi:hypothetical protein